VDDRTEQEMSELGKSMIKGMEEALAFAKGEEIGAVVHTPQNIKIKCILKKLGMSQNVFAGRLLRHLVKRK
jgi:DNA-binding transcriptional regulator YiaG